jgi:uncharacterized protein with HEPN domain
MPREESDDDLAFLWDMLQAAQKVQEFIGNRSFEQYQADEILQAAVERKIEIIGEAARRVSPATQAAHPEIEWRPITAQRHVLAHEYGAIKQDRIWRVATTHVPELIRLLRAIIPDVPPE